MGAVTRDPGSFRDPAGYVLHYGDAVYRSLEREAFDRLCIFLADPAYQRLSINGDLLPVAVADAERTREAGAPRAARRPLVCTPAPLARFIGYPYEWSPRMLHAAAQCTLRIEAALIERGFTLKDAERLQYPVRPDRSRTGPGRYRQHLDRSGAAPAGVDGASPVPAAFCAAASTLSPIRSRLSGRFSDRSRRRASGRRLSDGRTAAPLASAIPVPWSPMPRLLRNIEQNHAVEIDRGAAGARKSPTPIAIATSCRGWYGASSA